MRSHSTTILYETPLLRSCCPHWRQTHTLIRRQYLSRVNFGIWTRRRQVSVFVGKSDVHRSYEDLTRSYSRSLLREEAQLTITTPPSIQLVEVLEGFFLLTALSLQLIPVCYAAWSTNKTVDQTNADREAQQDVQDAVTESGKEQEMHTSVGVGSPVMHRLDVTQFSLLSALSLVAAVILGSVLRRFDRGQMLLGHSLMPSSPPGLNALDKEEMENNVSRAFGEISHLASQVEKLKIKTRLISNEYSNALESSRAESNQLKQALHEVVAQIKGTEQRIADLNDIMLKMQGFASRQFEVVSTALRRIDKDCKTLTSQLPEVETPEAVDIEETAKLDFQS